MFSLTLKTGELTHQVSVTSSWQGSAAGVASMKRGWGFALWQREVLPAGSSCPRSHVCCASKIAYWKKGKNAGEVKKDRQAERETALWAPRAEKEEVVPQAAKWMSSSSGRTPCWNRISCGAAAHGQTPMLEAEEGIRWKERQRGAVVDSQLLF